MPLVVYTLLRLVVLVAAFFVILWAGAQPLVAGVLAVVVASAVSYLFLRRQRDATAVWIAQRVERRKGATPRRGFARTVAEDEAAEDAATER
ncbi:DUF4229 domain-containing protein [Xylanimonas cellulosilytica]|uniref:DUF4229 domain-containing protein n=1 Tax=Xylanimonas cellulosilytica TaxID=186189 RepID=UPI001FE2005E|nr:DUF4229 domain-containing protein [Xylanimonas cellulosilytica]